MPDPDPVKIDIPVEQLSDGILVTFYDVGSLARGRAYAQEDRVKIIHASPGELSSFCQGSGQAVYTVRIGWDVARNANLARSPVDLNDRCSCPLGGSCKHCVATILTARRQAAERRAGELLARSDTPRREDWRRALADIAAGEDHQPRHAEGLALRFSVVRPMRHRFATETGPRVTVQALRKGKKGKWIKTGASWRDISFPSGQSMRDVDPAQIAALRDMITSAGRGYSASTDAVPLTTITADFWRHLEHAVELGVELIGSRNGDAIYISPTRARVGIDLTADETGSVNLSVGVHLDEKSFAVELNEVGLIGSPAHGVWISDGNRLTLAQLSSPLHPTVQRLATSGGLTVPAEDVKEFLDAYQPELARYADVRSSDGSVTITTTHFDGFVLGVERTALDVANLTWSVRYKIGDRSKLYRLRSPGGRGRDRGTEVVAARALDLPTHLLPELVGTDGAPKDIVISGREVILLFAEVLPWIETKCDVAIEFSGDQPALREATEDPLISLSVTDRKGRRDGNDWFDLDVEVSVDGETIDFVSLFAALSQDDGMLILPSGTWLSLDRPEFTKLRLLIDEARGLAEPTEGGVARVNRFQVSWWEELTSLGVVAKQSDRWNENVNQMASLAAPVPVAVPIELQAELRPYQQDGLDWLAFLYRNRLGGILADDMGLGKTVQTLALALHVLQDDPDARFLVIAPTSVVDNWAREAARFAPSLKVRTIHETQSRRGTTLEDEIDDSNLVVTSYALFRLEFDQYATHDWALLLIDEAQFVKNHQGKTYKCIRQIDATTKIAITGTPIENTLMDLWSLLSISAPGLYPDPKRFDTTFRKPIESGEAPELLATLRRRVAPLMRRRTKDAVLTELPPKTEQTVQVELSPRHARIYSTQLQRQRQKVLGLVGDVQKNRFEILKSLTILRQLALDPGLVDETHDNIGSSKLDRLMEDLTLVIEEGHRALVFSQFTRFLTRVRTRLDEAGIDHTYLDGRTRKRDEAISRFKDGDAPVFVISLKAGGVGLNLTEADYCFILDPWWNPATETQAVDRTHRMGQQNPVMVYRYVSTDTIEEKVMELKARKSDLFNSVMDDKGALSGALTEDDIRGLLDLG
ncbi:MAG: DEAD/DEAH box helicase [Microthrixaceae bacterium]